MLHGLTHAGRVVPPTTVVLDLGEYQGSACLPIGSAEHLISSSLPEPFDGLGADWKLRVHRDDGEACHPVHLGESNRPVGPVDGSLSGMPSRFELSTSGIDLVFAPIDLGADLACFALRDCRLRDSPT
jgi:hypothetical protein